MWQAATAIKLELAMNSNICEQQIVHDSYILLDLLDFSAVLVDHEQVIIIPQEKLQDV